jgi:choline monooxygenase
MTVTTLPRSTSAKLHPDPGQSYTLPAHYYTDPEIFAREREAIHFRSWQYAGPVGELAEAGDYITSAVLDQDIFVIRGKDGALRAFYNVCQHRAHKLLEGSGRKKVITCPYHAWSYHATGDLRSARGAEKVAGFDKAEFCLKQVRVEEFCNLVFVNLYPQAPSLAGQSGDLAAEVAQHVPALGQLKKVATQTWTIRANWKTIVDNFLECYHCEPAHPAFVKLVDIKSYRSVTHGIYSTHSSRGGKPDNPAYSFMPEDASQEAVFWYLWPMMTFNVTPGPANFTLFYLRPLDADHTLEVVEYYYLDGVIGAAEQARIDYANDVLMVEDNNLCEAVQKGLHSRGYDRGRFIVDAERSQNSEHAVHHFHTLVEAALEGSPA